MFLCTHGSSPQFGLTAGSFSQSFQLCPLQVDTEDVKYVSKICDTVQQRKAPSMTRNMLFAKGGEEKLSTAALLQSFDAAVEGEGEEKRPPRFQRRRRRRRPPPPPTPHLLRHAADKKVVHLFWRNKSGLLPGARHLLSSSVLFLSPFQRQQTANRVVAPLAVCFTSSGAATPFRSRGRRP